MTTSTVFQQGDVGLLDHDVARRPLASDGSPRVFPTPLHWTGADIVFSTLAGARTIAARPARPDVAVTIDAGGPPELLLRGRAVVVEAVGIGPEYALAQRRYHGEERGAAAIAQADRPGVRRAGIAVTPTRVGVFPGGAS